MHVQSSRPFAGCWPHRSKVTAPPPAWTQRASTARLTIIARAGFGKPAVDLKRKCACGSGQPFKACCEPFIKSAAGNFSVKPPSAEACLRARFAAYCTKSGQQLLLKTTSQDNPARKGSVSADGKVMSTFEQDVKVTMSWTEFKGLRILAQRQVGADATELDIEYSVRKVFDLQSGSKLSNAPWETLHETARFANEPGAGWVFSGSSNLNWDRQTLSVI